MRLLAGQGHGKLFSAALDYGNRERLAEELLAFFGLFGYPLNSKL